MHLHFVAGFVDPEPAEIIDSLVFTLLYTVDCVRRHRSRVELSRSGVVDCIGDGEATIPVADPIRVPLLVKRVSNRESCSSNAEALHAPQQQGPWPLSTYLQK